MPLIRDDQPHIYPKRVPQKLSNLLFSEEDGVLDEVDIEPPLKRQKTAVSSVGRKRWGTGSRRGGGRRGYPGRRQTEYPSRTNAEDYFEHTGSPGEPHTSTPGQSARTPSRRTMARTQPRYSTATAAAAAADGYKPREERGWDEFHPYLDLESDLALIPSEQVDGLMAQPDLSGRGHDTPKSENEVDEESLELQLKGPVRRGCGRGYRRTESTPKGLNLLDKPRVVPPPGPNPREKLTLPRPSYREHDPFLHYEQKGIAQVNFVDRSMAAVGYQESEVFVRPEHTFIRLMEGAAEEDLDLMPALTGEGENAALGGTGVGRVEYDMDEQDAKWLDMLNRGRKLEQVEAIKPAIFEITMTKVEKEWHALEKRIPRNDPKPPQTQRPRSSSAAAVNGEAGPSEEQDSKCTICDDGDCENANAIVFCDGCDLAVHQECYGVPYIPEGQWLCRKCQLLGRGTPSCIFCPSTEGAFKQTNSAKWSHLLCASWIPEVSIGNMSLMEPVLDVEKVPYSRWRLTCFICLQKMGACIQCSHRHCYQAFHVTCARRAKMYLRMKCGQGVNSLMDKSQLKALCDKHVSSEWRLEYDTERATAEAKKYFQQTMKNRKWADSQASALVMGPAEQETSSDGIAITQRLILSHGPNKRTKGQKPIWRLPSGAPVIPDVICRSIEASLQRFGVRKKKDFVVEVCKYWTMKREARRGAPLLKRLQLQIDSFSSGDVTRRDYVAQGATGRSRLDRRIDFGEYLLEDLRQLRHLIGLVKEREAQKLADARMMRDLVDTVYFPVPPMLRPVIDKCFQLDSKQVFREGLRTIRQKLNLRSYISVAVFSTDLARVLGSDLGVEAATTADLQLQVSGRAIDLTLEQRERRKLAKRIVKAVQPALEDALRKESELSGRPFEKQIQQLDMMLDSSVLSRRDSFAGSVSGDGADLQSLLQPMGNRGGSSIIDSQTLDEKRIDVQLNGLVPSESKEEEPEDDLITDAPSQPDELDESIAQSNVGLTADTDPMIMVDTPPASTNGIRGSAVNEQLSLVEKARAPMPAPIPEPPTPPLSLEGIQQPTMIYGGIPWYVEPFDPEGTTIHEERWTGPEVLREMSEELTDIDDEELQGLEDAECETEEPEKAVVTPTVTAIAAPRKSTVKKNGRTRRRWRGFK